MIDLVLMGIAAVAFACIVLEDVIAVDKAKSAFMFGCLSWYILFVTGDPSDRPDLQRSFEENVADIANLWLFLIAAMTFVAYLNKKGLIDGLLRRLMPREMSERVLLCLTGLFCFAFSSLADNITATLVCITLLLSLNLAEKTLLKFTVLIVFAVNSGGVALISGDVTTLMIFLDGRVAILNLLLLSLPSLAAVIVLIGLLAPGLDGVVRVERRSRELRAGEERRETQVRALDILIALLFLATIIWSMIANLLYQVPPVLSFLTGLSVMFMVTRFFREDVDSEPIMEYIRLIEFETLFFFLGVLLVVGMLQQISVLSALVTVYEMLSPEISSYLMGLLSALIDNVPLTAALLKAEPVMTDQQWLSLTYAVGVGGSLVVIGSAAGIVAMSRVPAVTIFSFARYGPALLIAYTCGYLGSWLVGRWLLV